jgi:hypothetical protein
VFPVHFRAPRENDRSFRFSLASVDASVRILATERRSLVSVHDQQLPAGPASAGGCCWQSSQGLRCSCRCNRAKMVAPRAGGVSPASLTAALVRQAARSERLSTARLCQFPAPRPQHFQTMNGIDCQSAIADRSSVYYIGHRVGGWAATRPRKDTSAREAGCTAMCSRLAAPPAGLRVDSLCVDSSEPAVWPVAPRPPPKSSNRIAVREHPVSRDAKKPRFVLAHKPGPLLSTS